MAVKEPTVRCPRCGAAIEGPVHRCGACGYEYDAELYGHLSLYFFLMQQRESLSRMNSEMMERMGEVASRLDGQAHLLDSVLSTRAAALTTERQEREKAAPPPSQEPAAAPDAAPPVETARKRSDLEIRMGQKWLLIAGVVTTVFGVGYFLKYSFDQGWIGPAGRVAMAYLFGIAILGAGDRFRKKDLRLFGFALIGGGIAVLYFATYAAFQIYGLFIAPVSFGLMVLTTALACALAVAYDNKWLAVIGLIGGFLTPLLLSTGVDNQPVLMGYMALLNLGILAVAFRKDWPLLTVLGFAATYILFSGWFAQYYEVDKFWLTISFLTLFYLIYATAPLAYHVYGKSEDTIRGLVIFVPNSFIAFGFSFGMIQNAYSVEWVSVATLFYALVFFVMALLLAKTGKAHLKAFVLLIAKSALFLILTVPILLSRHWITVFWAAQALTLLWAADRIGSRRLRISSHVLMALALGKFLFYDYVFVFNLKTAYLGFAPEYTHMIVERIAATIFLLAVTAAYWWLCRKYASTTGSAADAVMSRLVLIVAASILFIALNVETAAFFYQYTEEARFAAVTVLWTLFSAGIIMAGFRWNSAAARNTAIALFGVTVCKVFFFDIANFSTPFRILSFIILGIVLVCASYLYYRFKDRIIEAMSQDIKR